MVKDKGNTQPDLTPIMGTVEAFAARSDTSAADVVDLFKQLKDALVGAPTASQAAPAPAQAAAPAPTEAPKKRGRPKKTEAAAEPAAAEAPKKRGRPKKVQAEPAAAEAPKKRGRPKKVETAPAAAEAPKKRGRPKKSETKAATAEQPVKRGRGRPKKPVEPMVQTPEQAASVPEKPVISAEDSFTSDEVKCMCCGKGGMKMLKRHLGQAHGLTPESYREIYNLPEDHPLVAPSYKEQKAAYAAMSGLGKHERETEGA